MSANPQPGDPGIRPLREADLDAIMDIELRAYPYPWTAGIFLDCIRVGYHCWAYQSDDRLRGYAVMSCVAGEAHLLNICVDPDLQGNGIGRRLLGHALDHAQRLGAERMFLEVRPTNAPALKLYRDFGFSMIGTRRGYYPDDNGREDALVLARLLPL